jgi:Tol biopolymer transport system component
MQAPPARPAVTRFEVTTDAKLARMDWPRLSPDGRILAFQGTDKTGKTSIWLRPLDSKSAYLLAGTEGVNSRPFWSPDSKYLAYFEGTQLKKIPAAGGPTQTIGETEFGADGSWGKTGVILFDGRNATDSIRQVSATGGKPSYVFNEETRKTVPNNAWPFFLPDGKHFIFTSNKTGTTIASISICLGEIGSQETKLLTPTESRAEYANGYLIYVLKGTLVAHRFDVDQLKLIGDPVPLADHVNANGTRAAYSVSENGLVAYLEGTSASDLSEFLWLDRTGKELGKEGEPGLYSDVALSPDSKWLAYAVRETADGNRDLWLRDLQRHTSSRFTFNPGDDFRPTWSPDGKTIYFASNRGDELYRCYSKPANGTGSETVVVQDSKSHFLPASFSTDGKLLSLDRFGAGSIPAVVVTAADGSGEPTVLTAENPQSSGRFSPDGRFISYTSNETRALEVYVQSWPPGAGKWQVSQGGGSQARWRSDGKELFYRNQDFDYFAVPVTLDSQFSLGMPKPMFRRRTVTGGSQGTMGWTIAPDGQKFLLNATIGDASRSTFTVVMNWPETLQAR